MKNGLVVLSLFDGLSGAQIALERAGIPVKTYYASEIDKYAMQIAQKNYPNTIQLGDITRYEEWDIEQPDLIIGGSPCVGFSVAGRGKNFEDPQSKLFFTFIAILEKYKSRYFLLENVKMKNEWRDAITAYIQEIYPGVEPILINSARLSAQNRQRNYWTNIPNVTQPEDKGIYLQDIIEDGIVDRDKAYALTSSYHDTHNFKDYTTKNRRQIVYKDIPFPYSRISKKFQFHVNGITRPKEDQQSRIYNTEGKMKPMTASGCKMYITPDGIVYRNLTPEECERLQTIDDGYTSGISNTQRYKMLGNGFTVDVIAHILRGIHGNTTETE